MIHRVAIGAVAAAGMSMPAFADYTVSQGASAPAYTSQTLNFDEPGGPTGVVATDAWAGIGLSEMQAGDGVPQVGDFDDLNGGWGLGTGNSFYGNFGVFMTFDSDLTNLSLQVWDPSGPPSPIGGGLSVFLFNDGEKVGASAHTPAWGGVGDSWFDISADGGDVFDEVRILGFGFIPTTYVDNLSWDVVEVGGYAITQGASAPTYTDRTLDFDEPDGPVGVVATDAWIGLGLSEMQAGDGVPQVGDFDEINGGWGLGTGNSFFGNFGVFMTFDGDLTNLSLQVWDPSGPPSPFGGGVAIFLFNDGEKVAASAFTPAWGGVGDSWFDISALGDDVFDEVRILGFGFIPTTYVDNLTWDVVPGPCVGDINGDGVVSVLDLTAIILAWGTDDAAADVDGSGLVDVGDLVLVITGWGGC